MGVGAGGKYQYHPNTPVLFRLVGGGGKGGGGEREERNIKYSRLVVYCWVKRW